MTRLVLMDNLKYQMRHMFELRKGIPCNNDKFLDDGLLEKILNLSILNPSVFDSNPYSVLAVTTNEYKHRLYNLMNLNRYIMDSAAVLLFFEKSHEDILKSSYLCSLAEISLKYSSKYYGVDCSIINTTGIKLPELFTAGFEGQDLKIFVCLGYFKNLIEDTKKTTQDFSRVVMEI